MKYLQVNTGPCPKTPWWYPFLKRIIPSANPDLENYYFQVQYWWLEIDDNGIAKREIGFDIYKNPIVLGPVGHNYGCLVDSSEKWSNIQGESEDAQLRFDQIWEILYERFKHLG